ncbi:MAG: DUF1328 domain-containing protein [Planctomycetes bacterium]|nr:DUF1328 domain-containing protein [Planctomycetota bacterium]
MLRLALLFLVIALLCSLFGFGLATGVALEAARLLFIAFLVLLIVALIRGSVGSRPLRDLW